MKEIGDTEGGKEIWHSVALAKKSRLLSITAPEEKYFVLASNRAENQH